MNTNDEKIIKANKRNINLFKFYQMFSKDLLFYYAISFLFLTQEKGLNASQILFVETFYPVSKILVQFFATSIIDKTRKKTSIIWGNIFIALFFIFMIIAPNIYFCILSNFFLALGFAFKEVTESTFIFDFIIDTPAKKRSIYAKTFGKSSAYYLAFYSISCIVSGLLFAINPYLPLFCGLFVTILAIIISLFFKEPKASQLMEKDKHKKEKSYLKELKASFSYILNSHRLKLLLLFNALFYSFMSIGSIYRTTILEHLNFSSEYTGFLCALFACIAAYTCKKSHNIHNNLKNTTLTYLSLGYCLTTIVISAFIYFAIPEFFVYFIVLVMMSLQAVLEGPYDPLINQYLSNFTTSRIRTKIYTIRSLSCEGVYAIITFLSSLFLNFFSLPISLVLIGSIFTISFVILLAKMQTKVGLQPEQYEESEIYVK